MKDEKYEGWSELRLMKVLKESRADEIRQILNVTTDENYMQNLKKELKDIERWLEKYGKLQFPINCSK